MNLKKVTKLFGISSCLAIGLSFFTSEPARADLRFCGNFFRDGDVFIAIAYRNSSSSSDRRGANGWVSQGWWRLDSFPYDRCVTVIDGDLENQYYYYYVRGAHTWKGSNEFCVRNGEAFTLVERQGANPEQSCNGPNEELRGFREIDTGDDVDYTITLDTWGF